MIIKFNRFIVVEKINCARQNYWMHRINTQTMFLWYINRALKCLQWLAKMLFFVTLYLDIIWFLKQNPDVEHYCFFFQTDINEASTSSVIRGVRYHAPYIIHSLTFLSTSPLVHFQHRLARYWKFGEWIISIHYMPICTSTCIDIHKT